MGVANDLLNGMILQVHIGFFQDPLLISLLVPVPSLLTLRLYGYHPRCFNISKELPLRLKSYTRGGATSSIKVKASFQRNLFWYVFHPSAFKHIPSVSFQPSWTSWSGGQVLCLHFKWPNRKLFRLTCFKTFVDHPPNWYRTILEYLL